MLKNNKNFPQEFYNFIELFYGIPVDFSNPKVYIEDGGLGCVELTSVEFGDASECEVRISYVSNIDYETLRKDYIEDDDQLDEDILEDNDKEFFYSWEEEKAIGKKWLKKIVPCNFKGYVVTPDLVISVNGNLIQVMITSLQEEIIILYGVLGNNKRLNNVTLSSYNMFDFAENPYNAYEDLMINSDYLIDRELYLQSMGVNPEVKLDFDFNQFLDEIDLGNMNKSSLVTIYQVKEFLLNKVLESKKSKKK